MADTLVFIDHIDREKYIGERVDWSNDWICVTKRAHGYMIYNVKFGSPVLRLWFVRKEDALAFGALLHQWYEPLMWIWGAKGWENADIITLAQHTIPYGIRICEAIAELIPHKLIDNYLFEQFYRKVQDYAAG